MSHIDLQFDISYLVVETVLEKTREIEFCSNRFSRAFFFLIETRY